MLDMMMMMIICDVTSSQCGQRDRLAFSSPKHCNALVRVLGGVAIIICLIPTIPKGE